MWLGHPRRMRHANESWPWLVSLNTTCEQKVMVAGILIEREWWSWCWYVLIECKTRTRGGGCPHTPASTVRWYRERWRRTCPSSSHAKHEWEVVRWCDMHILVERELERCFPPKPRRSQQPSFVKRASQPRAPIDYPARISSHTSCPNACSILQRHLPCYVCLVVRHLVGSSIRQLAMARLERG